MGPSHTMHVHGSDATEVVVRHRYAERRRRPGVRYVLHYLLGRSSRHHDQRYTPRRLNVCEPSISYVSHTTLLVTYWCR